jgi:hypothetical protein
VAVLYVFLEGEDDERFFDSVLRSRFAKDYQIIETVKYAQMSAEDLVGWFDTILGMGADYLFLADYDHGPCFTERVKEILAELPRLERENLFIVRTEIESWYAAGVTRQECEEIGLTWQPRTDDLSKEDFTSACPDPTASLVDIKIELAERFDPETAMGRNRSFAYFADHKLSEVTSE